jgi:hypothetical protein
MGVVVHNAVRRAVQLKPILSLDWWIHLIIVILFKYSIRVVAGSI